jgi:hypothetical protein
MNVCIQRFSSYLTENTTSISQAIRLSIALLLCNITLLVIEAEEKLEVQKSKSL